MLKIAALLIALLVAPTWAFSQPRVYTNADLGRPMASDAGRPSPAEAAAIMAALQHEIAVPAGHSYDGWFPGPQTYAIPSSATAGPFGEFKPFAAPRRLDGTLLSEPAWSTAPVWVPGYARWRGGYGADHGSRRGGSAGPPATTGAAHSRPGGASAPAPRPPTAGVPAGVAGGVAAPRRGR